MSLLDILLRIFVYFIFVAPIAILVIGVILYFYRARHRFTLGIILISLGSAGASIYSIAFYISIIMQSGLGIFMWLVIVEVSTIVIGIISLTHNKPKPETEIEQNSTLK
jgi:hypothetical protein